MSLRDKIKELVKTERGLLENDCTIEKVKRIYKKQHGQTPKRADVTDALIELRKEGFLEYDLLNLKMRYIK